MSADEPSSQTVAALIALAEIGEAINANLPLKTILNQMASELARLVAGDAVSIALVDPSRQEIQLRACVNSQGQSLENVIGRTTPIAELLTVQTLLSSRVPLYIPDIYQSPLWRFDPSKPNSAQSFLGIPLIVEEIIVGLLFIDFYETDSLTPQTQYAALAFARYAESAIHNAQQRDKLIRSEERYRHVAALTSDAIYEWVPGDETILWTNDIDSLLHYEPGCFPRTEAAWIEAIHPHDRQQIIQARQITLRDGNRFEEEYRLRRENGTYCQVLDKAFRFETPTPRLLGAITDLTNIYELTDALIESEIRHRTLFTHALDAIFVIDKSGTLLDFNPAVESLTVRNYAELIFSTFHEIVLPQDLDLFTNAMQQLKQHGEINNFEIRLRRPDGSYVEVEVLGSALGGDTYQLVARDITARKQAQILAAQRIVELTALSDITRATMDGGDLVDMLKRVLPGAIKALELPLGGVYLLDHKTSLLQRVAYVGYPPNSDYPPLTLPQRALDIGQATAFSTLVRIVNPPMSDDETHPKSVVQVPIISNSTIVGMALFGDTKPRTFEPTDIYLIDIIGRQLGIGMENLRLLENLEQLIEARTQALRSTESRYRTLIEQVPGVVYTADTVTSGVSFISAGTEALFGISPPEFIHVDDILLACISPEDLPWVAELANRAMATEEDFDAQYGIINSQTHKAHWVHHRARPIVMATGEKCWLGLLTDVTNMKELDNLKNQFVATVSHELRTPLSAIKLRTATLNNYYHRLTDDQRLEMVQRISYQGDILADLIEDVLRLATLDGGTVERQVELLDLKDIGVDVIEELRPAAETAAVTLQIRWATHDCTIRADAVDISRIWRNLIGNAIKYTPEAGHIAIYTGSVIIDSTQHIISSTLPSECITNHREIGPGKWVVGVVEDTGRGISDYDRGLIFNRFFRGDAALTNIPGTGLGLSLVKELLEDYGGHIALNSSLGSGSTFAFWLPSVKEIEE
ncbi:MAG: PAS domain-containing protein [Chloroflexota bacterium]